MNWKCCRQSRPSQCLEMRDKTGRPLPGNQKVKPARRVQNTEMQVWLLVCGPRLWVRAGNVFPSVDWSQRLSRSLPADLLKVKCWQ